MAKKKDSILGSILKSTVDITGEIIKTGYEINKIDGLITNFHNHKSTLLLIIFCLIGKKSTMELYRFAIKKKLRFFSYGDACLIWNKSD